MQNDCEIYVDPEEDEVFFGCVSEREKFVSSKLVNCAESSPKNEFKLLEVSDGEGNGENVLRNERSSKVVEEIFIDDSSDSIQLESELKDSSSKILSDNTSVELEHNYSTPMKHKIDKSILATPKSVVKADRDGGFLKVLSEIALVKAEAEGNQKSEEEEEEEKEKEKEKEKEEEEENKENKLGPTVPEIKITEATPEKGTTFSPPRSVSTELRRFRIIYSSPQEDNVDPKSKSETFEMEKNIKNKLANREPENILEKEKRKSVDLIDFSECGGEPFTGTGGKLTPAEKRKESTDETDNTGGRGSENGEPDAVHHATSSTKKPPRGLRFSKEARKIVEVLKKSAADDTLNFTIPEIDVEEEENSFLSPGPVSGFDVTVIQNDKVQTGKSSPKILAKPADNKLALKSRTVEKERRNLTPVTSSQSKLQTMKYFSERRIYNQIGSEGKSKCAKKLPLEEKRQAVGMEKGKGGGQGESNPISSRIPVFGGAKNGVARTVGSKTTPAKTPTGKGQKNPKFNHIESPINAYIHNKPTSLLLNVKPEMKKDSLTKLWKPQTAGSERQVEEKTSKLQATVRLPFVEYRSATPYKIEKRPESRLPRLAPSVMKLIGNHSPKVLRHEGRFYVNSPRKEGATADSSTTLIADPKEVSVVVSQPVQKSNSRK